MSHRGQGTSFPELAKNVNEEGLISSHRNDLNIIVDKRNLDPVPEDKQEEVMSPMKRKLKMLHEQRTENRRSSAVKVS